MDFEDSCLTSARLAVSTAGSARAACEGSGPSVASVPAFNAYAIKLPQGFNFQHPGTWKKVVREMEALLYHSQHLIPSVSLIYERAHFNLHHRLDHETAVEFTMVR